MHRNFFSGQLNYNVALVFLAVLGFLISGGRSFTLGILSSTSKGNQLSIPDKSITHRIKTCQLFGYENNNSDFGFNSEDLIDESEPEALFGIVRRKSGAIKGKGVIDERDSLPFSVFSIVDDRTKKNIGVYKLDSTTACDDILDLGNLGVYSVQRVSFLYKFSKGKFRIFRKKLDVTLTKEGSIINSKANPDQFLQ